MQNKKQYYLALFSSVLLSLGMSVNVALAEPFADAPGLAEIMQNVLNFFLKIFGYIGVIAFLICGILYLTSRGDPKKAENAKTYLKYSVIGLAVGLLSLVIVKTVDSFLS